METTNNLNEVIKKLQEPTHWYTEVWYFVIYTIPRISSDTYHSVRYACQRVTQGYDDRMMFSHSYFHAEMMVRVLDDFINNSIGYPGMSDDIKCNTPEEWIKTLKIMRAGFQSVLDLEDDPFSTMSSEECSASQAELRKRFKQGMKLYTTYYEHLWD